MDKIENDEGLVPPVQEIVIVSGLSPADVEPLLDLAASTGVFTPDALMTAENMAWDTAYGDGREGHTYLLAKIHGEKHGVVGFICFGPIANWDGHYELYAIAVNSDYRRQGIGAALVAELKRRAMAEGAERIYLETGEGRAFKGAHAFYEANDFVQEHRFHKNFIPFEGGVVYRLDLESPETEEHFQ